MTYQAPRSTRRENRTIVGRFRGGKLAPVGIAAVRPSEAGMLSQSITIELDPIAGRMITPITAEMISVFVPVQAIDAIKDPAAQYAGMTEVLREKLLAGNPLFGLEAESEISKRLRVNPRSVGGVLQVNEMARLAHNAAVNHLRISKYHKATKLLHSSTAITPALIGETVLDRLNGVLDPDDRINGAVNLDIPNMSLPVTGIGLGGRDVPTAKSMDATGGITRSFTGWQNTQDVPTAGKSRIMVEEDPLNPTYPKIFAELNGAAAGNVSLTDFYNAETQDKLTRKMRQIVDENPEYGEEMVLRWAHGLAVDTGKTCFTLAKREVVFGRDIARAQDGAGITADVMRSDMMVTLDYTVPIPKTELGGVVITFATVKPDETLGAQPHPILSDVWGLDNYVADELALDPVPVTMRELDSAVAQVDETTVALYTGLNQLKVSYIDYGLNRHVDPLTVENKTAIWQLIVPMSVTPDNILYPDTLSHYPFADQNAEVASYTFNAGQVVQSPMIVGPTPVEELAVITSDDLFETAPV